MSDNIKPQAIELSEQELDEVAGGSHRRNSYSGYGSYDKGYGGSYREGKGYGDYGSKSYNGGSGYHYRKY